MIAVNYGPYGELLSRSGKTITAFLYVGKLGVETDTNGLIYMRARYYNPAINQFINEDPIKDGLNWYGYVNGNPISFVDPEGLASAWSDKYDAWGERIDFRREDIYRAQNGYGKGKGITFSQDLYDNDNFYKATADYIAQISKTDSKFDSVLENIKSNYDLNKSRYEQLAKDSNIPPELIAAIHYREAAKYLGTGDYFNVYLHNGDLLGKNSNIVPYPEFFSSNQFDDAALDALKGWDGTSNYKENRANQLKLTFNSKDLTAMVTYSVFYNGWVLKGKTSYAYSGTDIFSGGQHTSDHNYDPNAIDANAGVYIILKKLLGE